MNERDKRSSKSSVSEDVGSGREHERNYRIGGASMKRRSRSTLASLGLALFCLACGGDGGGSSPTAPPAPSGRTVQVIMVIGGFNFSRTIQDARLLWDNSEIARYSGTANNQVNWLVLAPIERVGVGSHTVSVIIDRQSRSPTSYRLDGALTSTAPGRTAQVIPLFVSSTAMRTGEPHVFRIQIE